MTENAFHGRMQRSQDEFVACRKCRWLWPIFGTHPEIASSENYGHPVGKIMSGKRITTGQAHFDETAALQMFSRKASWECGRVVRDHQITAAE
jgi:hypothetical protein